MWPWPNSLRLVYSQSLESTTSVMILLENVQTGCMCPLVSDFLQEPLLSASDVSALIDNGTWKVLDEVCLPLVYSRS